MSNTSTRLSLSIPQETFAAFLRATFPDAVDVDAVTISASVSWEKGKPISVEIEQNFREVPVRIASVPVAAVEAEVK